MPQNTALSLTAQPSPAAKARRMRLVISEPVLEAIPAQRKAALESGRRDPSCLSGPNQRREVLLDQKAGPAQCSTYGQAI